MKKPTESALVRSCLDYLRLRGIMAWRSNNIPAYDPKRQVYRSFHGLKGVSDIIGVVPRTIAEVGEGPRTIGCILAVECKRPGGRLTAAQRDFLDNVRRAGGLALVVRSLTELERALEMEGVFDAGHDPDAATLALLDGGD